MFKQCFLKVAILCGGRTVGTVLSYSYIPLRYAIVLLN
jgi:hypothetical protein